MTTKISPSSGLVEPGAAIFDPESLPRMCRSAKGMDMTIRDSSLGIGTGFLDDGGVAGGPPGKEEGMLWPSGEVEG